MAARMAFEGVASEARSERGGTAVSAGDSTPDAFGPSFLSIVFPYGDLRGAGRALPSSQSAFERPACSETGVSREDWMTIETPLVPRARHEVVEHATGPVSEVFRHLLVKLLEVPDANDRFPWCVPDVNDLKGLWGFSPEHHL